MVHRIENIVIDVFLSGLTAFVETFLLGALLFLIAYGINQLDERWLFIVWPFSYVALLLPPLWLLGSWFFKFRDRQRRRMEQISSPVNVGS